jgi:dienelactone hydrolase
LLVAAGGVAAAPASDVSAQHGAHGPGDGKPVLPGFVEETFRHSGDTRHVYVQGEGAPLLLLHELGGMSWATILLAQRVADRGFRVYVPRLFGGIGQLSGFKGVLQSCFGPDWDCSNPDGTSRILDWIHALVEDIGRRNADRRIGAIGMCLTGAFPLALMDVPQLRAAVLSQPALPLRGAAEKRHVALGLSRSEIERAEKREDARFLAVRFSADDLCREERFATLKGLLGDRLETIVIPSGPGTSFPREAHAVLTGWYDHRRESATRQAFEKIVTFLNACLASCGTRFPGDGAQLGRRRSATRIANARANLDQAV